MKKTFIGFSIAITLVCVSLIVVLATGAWKRFLDQKTEEQVRTRIVMPREANFIAGAGAAEQLAWEENFNTRVPMEEWEIVITVLTQENENGLAEEQVVAYRQAADAANQVYLTWIGYDERSMRHIRMWNAPTAVTRPETISLFFQDLIGNRSNCVVVTGMNSSNEHTMTIFKRNSGAGANRPFSKIAELQIDGSIIIQESGRSYAYQQGIASGQSFNIAAYGQDSSSNNILDQIETIYAYNSRSEQYEQVNVSRIPGSQVEQRRLRELLSGAPGVFENFINDLWYYVSPQGTIDTRQYIYFDSSGKEIIFFSDETQQVFYWQNSTPTRYGLYITSQNISISTLRRSIDIQLESLDSIKLRVIEDLRLKITINESWDGSYRRAAAANTKISVSSVMPANGALYESPWGRLQFYNTGEYSISSSGATRKGRYVFFKVYDHELLELRPDEEKESAENRAVYKVDITENGLSLSRVRLGAAGIQDTLEPPLKLTLVE